MQKGDFVYIRYVGRIKESGEIFDLTDEEVAKKEGIYNPEVRYGDIPIIIGANFIIPGLEEEIEKMNVGEKKTVEIQPAKAFGERRDELIKTFPEIEFRKQNIEPRVGEYITVNGISGRIISVNGGRVKVDFNHPLAGKTLVYEVEVTKLIVDLKEKIYAILKYFANLDERTVEVKINGNELEIEIKEIRVNSKMKDEILKTIFKWLTEIKRVKFSETFEKK
ncbi:MAG: FKBP-type peptidyl-prolyl cis-trans isomerase [Candidatus Aenigmarchaeota archaeon]|nr:peptidylprolyl isomerase [Candidatus Aenigmarchaeota archaeon]MCX8190769.1 peptidylprolyl isomerase [Candidatus Aenigmarchaeota archaeon]MDW8160016.1 FKBP-type peptidyl-prolyl cis-trans isomerase [Candidatus Aenigmarchaeota archaeon]